MNTAERSNALLDATLRRRFAASPLRAELMSRAALAQSGDPQSRGADREHQSARATTNQGRLNLRWRYSIRFPAFVHVLSERGPSAHDMRRDQASWAVKLLTSVSGISPRVQA